MLFLYYLKTKVYTHIYVILKSVHSLRSIKYTYKNKQFKIVVGIHWALRQIQ